MDERRARPPPRHENEALSPLLSLPDDVFLRCMFPFLESLGTLQRCGAINREFLRLSRSAACLEELDLAPLGPFMTDERLCTAVRSSGPPLRRLVLAGAASLTGRSLVELAGEGRLAAVTELDLSGCGALEGGYLPYAARGLGAVRTLSLHGSSFALTDETIAALLSPPLLPQLRHLDLGLSGPNVGGHSITSMWIPGPPRNLLSLSLSRHKHLTTDALLGVLERFSDNDNLTSLDLARCSRLDETALDLICEACPELQVLSLKNVWTVRDDAVVLCSTELPRLRSLNLAGCDRVTDTALCAISENLLELEELHLSRTPITDIGLGQLAQRGATLRHLYLTLCDAITDEALGKVVSACSGLETLVAADCREVSGSFLAHAVLPPTLEVVTLRACASLDDASIETLVRQAPRLRRLGVRLCERLTDASLLQLAQHSPLLEVLDLGQDDLLTDAGVLSVLRGCRSLWRLNLEGLCLLTDETVKGVAAHCAALRSLSLKFVPNVTNAAVRKLRRRRPLLASIKTTKNSHQPLVRYSL